VRAFDNAMSQLAGRPVSVRVDAGLETLRGRIRSVDAELTEVEVGGLIVDHLLVRVADVEIVPGVPPRVRVPSVNVAVTVTQRGIDRWLLRERLPLRMRLGARGLAAAFSLDTLGLGEIETELAVSGGWLQLRPRRAGMIDVPEVAREIFSGYLPLPRLPAGARLDALQHEPRELTAHLVLPGLDQPLGAGLAARIRAQFFPDTDKPPGT